MKNIIRDYGASAFKVVSGAAVISLFALGFTESAWAQLSQVNNVATAVHDTLKIGGTAVAASATAVSGYKVAFQGARFEDVSKVLIGGTLIGGSTAVAGWLLGSAS